MATPKKAAKKVTCPVCLHPERHRIEVQRLAGTYVDTLCEHFGLKRDSIYRHMEKHVRPEVKAAIIADVPLRDLADKAAAEGLALLDYLHLIRGTVVTQMQGAASVNDRAGVSTLAKRAIEVVQVIGRLTGEMMQAAPVKNVTHNTAVFMQSPAFTRLEQMLMERLAPHPDALRAVLAGLESLEGGAATHVPPTIDLPALEAAYAD